MKFLTISTLLIGFACICGAMTDPLDEANYRVTPKGYLNQGGFVEWPARAGCVTFTATGYFVTLPLTILRSPSTIFLSPGRVWKYSGVQSKQIFGNIGYYIFGTPPLLIKRGFWDGPIYIWNLAFAEPETESTKASKAENQKAKEETLLKIKQFNKLKIKRQRTMKIRKKR